MLGTDRLLNTILQQRLVHKGLVDTSLARKIEDRDLPVLTEMVRALFAAMWEISNYEPDDSIQQSAEMINIAIKLVDYVETMALDALHNEKMQQHASKRLEWETGDDAS